jgi:hypothetical protein
LIAQSEVFMSCSVQTKIHFIQRQINLYTELDEIGPAFEHGDLEDVTAKPSIDLNNVAVSAELMIGTIRVTQRLSCSLKG